MTERLKGAVEEVAARMDRKRFVRRLSSRLFMGFAVVTAGGGLGMVRASVAGAFTSFCEPTGPGCPHGCGPSACCNNGGRSAGCVCGTGTNCANNGSHCFGYAGTWSGDSCWTCYTSSWYTCLACRCREYTTCCDCATSGCGDSSGHCVSYYSGVERQCPPRVATNDPASIPVVGPQ
jgi:hypothetical protein